MTVELKVNNRSKQYEYLEVSSKLREDSALGPEMENGDAAYL